MWLFCQYSANFYLLFHCNPHNLLAKLKKIIILLKRTIALLKFKWSASNILNKLQCEFKSTFFNAIIVVCLVLPKRKNIKKRGWLLSETMSFNWYSHVFWFALVEFYSWAVVCQSQAVGAVWSGYRRLFRI